MLHFSGCVYSFLTSIFSLGVPCAADAVATGRFMILQAVELTECLHQLLVEFRAPAVGSLLVRSSTPPASH